MTLKDNNLGLGARANQDADSSKCFGAFSDILGRLNGKTVEQIGKESQARADLGRKLYAEQRYGPSRFVRGGFLVGDRIEVHESVGQAQTATRDAPAQAGGHLSASAEDRKRIVEEKRKESKKRRHKGKATETNVPQANHLTPTNHDRQNTSDSATKGHRKKGKKSGKPTDQHDQYNIHAVEIKMDMKRDERPPDRDKCERQQRREEKRRRKEKRRVKKLEQLSDAGKDQELNLALDPKDARTVPGSLEGENVGAAFEQPEPSTMHAQLSTRDFVHQRAIHQKRLAFKDPQALKQV